MNEVEKRKMVWQQFKRVLKQRRDTGDTDSPEKEKALASIKKLRHSDPEGTREIMKWFRKGLSNIYLREGNIESAKRHSARARCIAQALETRKEIKNEIVRKPVEV